MPGTRSKLAILFLACLALVLGLPDAGAQENGGERWIGQWLATVDTGQEQVEFGFELRPGDDGLEVRLTQPLVNRFDMPAGTATWDGEMLRFAALGLALRPSGARLVGKFPGSTLDLAFERVDALPRPTSMPEMAEPPDAAWELRLGGRVFGTPAVADGIAYVGTDAGVVAAIELADGALRWSAPVGAAVHGEIAVGPDAIYFVANDGRLHAHSRADGAPQWSLRLVEEPVRRVEPFPGRGEWHWRAPRPALVDDVVYAGYAGGGLHAIDAATGQPVWHASSAGFLRTGPATNAGLVVFATDGGSVHALDRATGQEVWQAQAAPGIGAHPVISGTTVLVVTRGFGLHALDLATGAERWRLSFWSSWVESEPVVADGTIYLGSSDMRRVSAVDLATGTVLWRRDMHGWPWATPLLAGSGIVVATAEADPYDLPLQASLSVLDRNGGDIMRQHGLPRAGGFLRGAVASPVLSDGLVVVATVDGMVTAYRLTALEPGGGPIR